MRVGLYAGSFDPVHRGHVGLIEVAAGRIDRLFVVAAGNPAKAGALLSLAQRAQLISFATAHLSNVEALAHEGLVIDLARQLGVDVLVRSMGKEQKSELQMAATNDRLSGVPHTVLLARRRNESHLVARGS